MQQKRWKRRGLSIIIEKVAILIIEKCTGNRRGAKKRIPGRKLPGIYLQKTSTPLKSNSPLPEDKLRNTGG